MPESLHLAFSVPTGFHARELLVPLKPLLEADAMLHHITLFTPAAPFRQQVFPDYDARYTVRPYSDQKTYEASFRQYHPDIVITTTAGLDPNDVELLAAAKAVGVRTFTFIASWDNVWKMERLKKFGKPYVLADHLAVWNQMMSDHLHRIFPELSDGQVSIIGAPRFDYFWHTDKIPSRSELFGYLGIPDDGGKLIHIGTTELYPMDYVVAALASPGGTNHTLHLYASVHPGGDIKKHEAYAKKYGVTLRYSFGRQDSAPLKEFLYNPSLADIYRLIALFKHTDVLVNHSSTLALESLAADVPVINVKYGQPFDWWHWYRSMVYRDFKQHYRDVIADGATTIVATEKQLMAALATYLDHPELHREDRQKTLQKMITNTDGTATQRMFTLIKKQVCGEEL